DGVPLDLAVRLLPRRSWLRPGLMMHLHLHERLQRTLADEARPADPGGSRMSRRAVLGLIDSLESTVRGLSWRPPGRGWSSYYQDHSYAPAEFALKARLVRELLDRTRARTAWDLGSNTGHFSAIAGELGLSTVAFDFDPACIERIYREARDRRETKL